MYLRCKVLSLIRFCQIGAEKILNQLTKSLYGAVTSGAVCLLALPIFASPAEPRDGAALIGQQICDYALSYHHGGKSPGAAMEFVVSIHLDFDETDPDYQSKVLQWWNAHSDQVICVEETAGYESPQHVLKRIFEMGAWDSFFREYLSQPGLESFDLNSIEMVDGRPETLLDYLDMIIAKEGIDEAYRIQVLALRNYRHTIGARTATELNADS